MSLESGDKTDAVVNASSSFELAAYLLGDRFDLRRAQLGPVIRRNPFTIRCGESGTVVLFRFGALVFADVTRQEQEAFIDALSPIIQGRYEEPEVERYKVVIGDRPQAEVSSDIVYLPAEDANGLQVVADILARSVLLDRYERLIQVDFDKVESIAVSLPTSGVSNRLIRQFLDAIGGALTCEHKMLGRGLLIEKPDLLWEKPSLEGLFLELQDEFEILERYNILQQKLEFVTRTARTALEWAQDRRTYRVEVYIVVLIVVEIILTLYEMFFRHA